jgi:hypothetical protein
MGAHDRIADWHFPTDEGGVVRAGSNEARRGVEQGTAECDFALMTERLHTLQDSWSHQGNPSVADIGHSRGMKWVPGHTAGGVVSGGAGALPPFTLPGRPVPGHYEDISGTPAGIGSTSADEPALWPQDIRQLGRATYEYLKEYREKCPCPCGGPNGKPLPNWDGRKPATMEEVRAFLQQRFPRRNVQHGDRLFRRPFRW